MLALLNVLAYVGAIAGALVFFVGMQGAQSAPQEAAVAGMALVMAFVPYALARVAGAAADRKLLQEIAEQARSTNRGGNV